ncbi:MAG TPA: phosphatase PAP2 family protein [Kofleriaceae bacterium]
MRSLRVVLILVAAARIASADPKPPLPWYAGDNGHRRVLHLSITTTLGVAYLVSETLAKRSLAADECRWCDPPGFDKSIRDALVWNDRDLAATLSNYDAYLVSPLVGLTLLALSDKDASWTRLIDDGLPVLETVAISQAITQIVKFSVGRARPFVRLGTGPTGDPDDNLSFWSGHSALAFGITTSAGLVAHWRHYWTEPYIWAAGITLSLSTEYLRIGADKHYFSDVLIGGLVGIGSGLTIPRLLRRDLVILPVGSGAAVVGSF